ncbi:MAG: S1 RNA-binding domain-containing protein [archaeon]
MLLHRTGIPEIGELTLCKVTSIQYNSVFVHLEEYGTQGMIHISEISAGRIRNIRDFVTEGKVIICKVLDINREKGHIDLSLRRVSEGHRREKASELKQEQRAEKIIELLAHELKKDVKDVYQTISTILFKNYQYTFQAFEQVSTGELIVEDLGIPSDYYEPLKRIIAEKMRPKVIEMHGTITLQTYETGGVTLIKTLLADTEQHIPNCTIRYLGGGQYSFKITDNDYKQAEKTLINMQEFLEAQTKAKKIKYAFARAES